MVSSNTEVLSPWSARKLSGRSMWRGLVRAWYLVSEWMNEQMSRASPLWPERMRTQWQRAVPCDVLRGTKERQGSHLAWDANISHVTVTTSSRWRAVGAPCETRHPCFPRGPSHLQLWDACRAQQEISQMHFTRQCFEEVNGSLFTFLAFAKIDDLSSWFGPTYKMHFHLPPVLGHCPTGLAEDMRSAGVDTRRQTPCGALPCSAGRWGPGPSRRWPAPSPSAGPSPPHGPLQWVGIACHACGGTGLGYDSAVTGCL